MKGGRRHQYLLLSALFTLRLSTGELLLVVGTWYDDLPPFAGQQPSSPQFSVQPSNVTAYRSTILPCAASGTPTPIITWFRDGSLLDVTADPALTITDEGLDISGLQDAGGEELEGEYHCLATNQLGAVRSQSAVLTRTGEGVGGKGMPASWKHGVKVGLGNSSSSLEKKKGKICTLFTYADWL